MKQIALRFAALTVMTVMLSACAMNNALTLMEASKQSEPLLPDAMMVKQELKGRKLLLRYVYYDTERGIHAPEEFPRESYLILLRKQVQEGFDAANVDHGHLINESVLAYKQGDYKKSLEKDLKALDAVERQFGSGHPGVSIRLISIGETYSKLGQYDKAREVDPGSRTGVRKV